MAASTDEQDRSDTARLTSGQDTALNDLMSHYAERLYHYLFRMLQNEIQAADLTQETFVRVYLHRTRFKSSLKFSTWLYAIASNLVRDRYRWRSRHPQVSLDAENAVTGDSFRDLSRTSSGITSLPTSCKRAAKRISRSCAAEK